MEQDEFDDELPPISVNSSKQDESVFAMPSAEVLASQRARVQECERELQQLRAQHELQDAALTAASNSDLIAPSRSNSSGSEGETALVTAVEALRVGSTARSPQLESASSLLERMLPHLPPDARALSQAFSEARHSSDVDALTDDIITSIWSWLSGLGSESAGLDLDGKEQDDGQHSPSDDEVLGVGAWLCACALSGQPAARARRALHALLAAATHQQVVRLAQVLVPALGSARALLGLSQALSGACPPLVHAVHHAALVLLLQPDQPRPQVSTDPLTTQEICELVTRGWKLVSTDDREVAVQLVGRALLAAKCASETSERASETDGERAALARALATLAQSAGQADKHRPDHLKIAVAASKLKILLSDRN